MTIYRGPGGTGTATSDSDTTEFQEFVVDAQAARDAALAAQTAAELAETNAETAETNAETAETNAETAATNAASSASSAASSASSASSSASAASTSASNASSSASSASTSASAASSSASAASTSASNAATSATNAASSATAAASSASSASSSASTATTQATNAAASASAASTSASSASAAQTAAEAARDAALSAYDNFDDRYLGPKSSDPTLDNDGNALLTGALYFNTSSNVMKVYTGSSWVAAYVSAAGVLLTANNLSDVASTATSRTNLNVPTRTGGDASGSWGIDITGNAATATTATNVSGGTASVTSITDSGNLAFTSTGNRITGDFSNATPANRVALQTSTTNGATTFEVIPNGTGTTAQISLESDSAVTTGSTLTLANISTEVTIRSNLRGAGTYTPMTFYTGGSERVRVDTSGNVGIGTSSPGQRLTVGANGAFRLQTGSVTMDCTPTPGATDGFVWNTSATSYYDWAYAGSVKMRIDSSGNFLVGSTSGPSTNTRVYAAATTQDDNNGIIQAASSSNSASLIAKTPIGTAQFFQWENYGVRIGSRAISGSNTGAIYFSTGNDAVAASLDAGRLFKVGDVGPGSGGSAMTVYGGSGGDIVQFHQNRNSSTPYWYFNTSGGYGVFSDARLKENITLTEQQDSVDFIKGLEVVEFNWKPEYGNAETRVSGFLAQNVLKSAKTEGQKNILTHWETYDENNPECKHMGLSDHRVIPSVVHALQAVMAQIEAQQAIITALTARVNALESN